MRGVNATAEDLLDLCFALQGEANILPYYFYMCDMIPNAEHWRTSLAESQDLQLEKLPRPISLEECLVWEKLRRNPLGSPMRQLSFQNLFLDGAFGYQSVDHHWFVLSNSMRAISCPSFTRSPTLTPK